MTCNPQSRKCDGNHGGPRCHDPECWNDAALEADEEGVLFGYMDRSVRVSQEAYAIFLDRERALEAQVAALSRQAEPRCTYCDGAGDVHRADGEWLGACECQAAGPAPAQDEREAFEAWRLEKFCGGTERLKKCSNAPDVYYYAAEQEAWKTWRAALATRPAQTEQQPCSDTLIKGAKALLALDEKGSLAPHGIGGLAREVIEKLIDRVEHAAPQPEQEPFWYAVVSEQAPSINSAIKRLDVAQEFADSKRERWPDTRVVPLYTAPQPEQGGLVEAARGALAAIQDVLEGAYRNAYPECCGQAHLECCGAPVQAWSEADQKTMERFAPHEKALRAALTAQGGE